MPYNTIQDTRKIVAPSSNTGNFFISNSNPYFNTATAWTLQQPGMFVGNNEARIVTPGFISAFCGGFGLNKKRGFIVDVIIPVGTGAYISLNDGNGGTTENIYSSGRYVGFYTCGASPDGNTYLWSRNTTAANPIIFKEAFFFDAELYTYLDFLESPISYLSLEQKDTPDSIEATSPRLGWADAIPTTGNWRVGDRLESTVWDGKFSSTIAWVCTAAGTPGTWAAVTMYDAWASNKDPYIYSYIGGAWSQFVEGNATIAINNAILTLAGGSTGRAVAHTFNIECSVFNELVTFEAFCLTRTGGATDFAASGDYANKVVQSGTGSFSADATLTAATAAKKLEVFQAVNLTSTYSKILIRPKYPFLTKAPASFAALPPSYPIILPETWYADANVTYAASALIFGFGTTTAGIYQRVPYWIPPGRVLRARVNITALDAGAAPSVCYYGSGGSWQFATLPASTGMKEITFNVASPYGLITFGIHQPNGSTGTFSIDYVRFYIE